MDIILDDKKSTPPDWEMTTQDWIAVLGASLGAFISILDIQITNASLREIQGSLGLDISEGGWISTSYLIAEIIVIPLTGYLSNVFGMKKYIMVNSILFIFASIFCGLAWNLNSMIIGRVLQGLFGGVLIPMAFQIILLFMPPQKKTIGLALFGMTATLAPTLGPTLGGWLTENYGWRTNFFINIIPGLLLIAAIQYGMPWAKSRYKLLRKIDIWGTFTLILGLGTLTYTLEEGPRVNWFQDHTVRICFLIALVSLPLFVTIQLLSKNPLLKLKLMKNPSFSISAIITMVTGGTLYGGIYALSLYLAQIQSYGAIQIGKVMMWIGIPQLFIMPTLPFIMKKIDLKILSLIGLSLFMLSNFMNSHLNMAYSGDQFQLSLIVRALGQPLFMIPLSAIAMTMISPAEASNASSIYNVFRNLGGSIGIAITGTFITTREGMHAVHFAEHLSLYDSDTVSRINLIQNGLMLSGINSTSAKELAIKSLLGLVHRDAIIQSFSDVFTVMTYALLICIMLLFILKKGSYEKSGFGAH